MTKVGVTQCQSNGGLFMMSHRAMYQVTVTPIGAYQSLG